MIKTEEINIPGFSTAKVTKASDYAVRVMRSDITDPTSLAELEIVLTRGIEAKDIVIVDKDKYTFMDKYYIIVTYLEKRAE